MGKKAKQEMLEWREQTAEVRTLQEMHECESIQFR
jgi:hypothetical protein